MVTGNVKAVVDGTVIAEATEYEVVEGNIYFPPASLKKEYLASTEHHTTCPWKGKASYYTINVDGKELKNAAWYYPAPSDAASNIKDYVAFYTSKVAVTAN